jgi:hypothetical protein
MIVIAMTLSEVSRSESDAGEQAPHLLRSPRMMRFPSVTASYLGFG